MEAPSVVSILARKHSRIRLGRGLLTLELAGWLGASGKNSKSLLRSKFRHLLLSCIWENCLPSFPLPSWSQTSSSLAWLRVAPVPPRFLLPGADLTSLAEQAHPVSIFLDPVMSTKVLFVSIAEAVGKQIPPRTNAVRGDKTRLTLELLQALPWPLCLIPISLASSSGTVPTPAMCGLAYTVCHQNGLARSSNHTKSDYESSRSYK